MSDVLEQLAETLEQRKKASPDSSYVSSLHHTGLNKILEKVGEEATETLLAPKDLGADRESEALKKALVGEAADLWFHTMVMLGHLDLDHSAVLEVLDDRMGLSGLAEKAARKGHNAPSESA